MINLKRKNHQHGKFFSTELSDITENLALGKSNSQNHSSVSITVVDKYSYENNNKKHVYSNKFPILNSPNNIVGGNTNNIQTLKTKQLKKNNSTIGDLYSKEYLFVLPKVNVREMSLELIPKKSNIYSKMNIKDIINFTKIAKAPFKH